VLPPPVAGERVEIAAGLVAWVGGQGLPLLLVHSVNAAASAAEVRSLFEHAAKTRRVVAIELPGFGSSDRSDRAYTPRLMTDALHAASAWIRERDGARPIDALAVSLGCEFLARAAAEQPTQWGRLALVSPTGFAGGRPRRGEAGSSLAVPGLLPALKLPLWSQPLFAGLTRPSVVRYFLRKTWGAPDIDEAMAEYAILTARQPGARFAPLAFLSGGLFSADIQAVYEQLAQPVWMSHGTRGDFTDYRGKTLVEGRPNWRITVYDSGALPYFERGNRFYADFDAFFD
jgi:pimeloyl-ACP methyl ester carboxylesterase